MVTKYLNAKNGIEIWHDDKVIQILSGSDDPSVTGLLADIGSLFLKNSIPVATYIKQGVGDIDWFKLSSDSGGISIEEHNRIHDGDKYIEIIRSGNKVVALLEYKDSSKTEIISTYSINRVAGKVSTTLKNIYDQDGSTISYTVSGTVTRDNNKVVSVNYITGGL